MLVHLEDNTFDSIIFVFSRLPLLSIAKFWFFYLVSYRRLSKERNERNEDSEQLYKRYSLFLFFLLPSSSSSSLASSLSSSSDLDLNQHYLRRSFQHHHFSFLHFLHLPLLTPSPSGTHWFLFRSLILPPETPTASACRNNMISLEALPQWQIEWLPC